MIKYPINQASNEIKRSQLDIIVPIKITVITIIMIIIILLLLMIIKTTV